MLTTNVGVTTTYFVGVHYEVENGVVIKYYYAGTQRIAMRKNGTLTYILGDHLGSTSLVTDSSGTVINQTKYKAWGETRYSSGTEQTKYTYTGQYSYASDFGLYYYNARWYDSSLGRFAQADTIVPGGSQGLDRYAYVNNSPLNYIDPSGHCAIDAKAEDCLKSDKSNSHVPSVPDYIDPDMLKKTVHGEEVYDFYVKLFNDKDGWWWQTYGSDGHFSAWEFIGMMYGYELDVVVSDEFYYEEAYPLYMEAMVRNSREYCEVLGCDASTLTGAFMHLSFYSESTQKRAAADNTTQMYILNSERITGGADLVSAIQNPSSFGHPEWNVGLSPHRPYAVGNESLRGAPKSWMYKIGGGNPMYILSGCQAFDYWGDTVQYENWGCP